MILLEGQNLMVIGIAALIFFSLGGAAGWLISQLRAENSSSLPPPPDMIDQGSEPIPPPSPSVSDKIELARIYRHRQTQQIFLEADQRPLKTPADVRESERGWLIAAVKFMTLLLDQQRPRQAEPGPTNVDGLQLAVAPLPRLDAQLEAAPQIQKPSMNPADILIRAVKASQVKIDHAKTLAGQIDDVLQEMLKDSPQPVGDIHLVDNPGLGLEVWVGLDKYDGIDAVPDEAVRQVIRAAIAEWQRRSQKT